MSYSNKQIEEVFESLDKEYIEPIVDQLLKEAHTEPPPGSLQSKDAWKAKIHKEWMDFCSAKDMRKKYLRGFDLISSHLSRHLSKTEWNHILDEWDGVREKIESETEDAKNHQIQKQPEEGLPIFSEKVGISDQTLGHMYHVGNDLFEHKKFEDAARVYEVVTTLNIAKPNAWLALGLSYLSIGKQETFRQAIGAFAMAAITNAESAWPHIYSAQCYLELHDKPSAKASLELAKEISTKHRDSEAQKIVSILEQKKR